MTERKSRQIDRLIKEYNGLERIKRQTSRVFGLSNHKRKMLWSYRLNDRRTDSFSVPMNSSRYFF